MYVQYEHASGYVLVHCDQTDDINQMDVSDWGEFGQICKLTAFKPFTSAANALDNMNAISEGFFGTTVHLCLNLYFTLPYF